MSERLIDGKVVADGMIDSVVDTKRDMANGLLRVNLETCKARIEDKVEAIPIEWLKKHKYSNIIDLWEKDCRLKDTKSILDELLSEHNFRSYNEYIEYAGKITALPRDDRLDILFKEKENA